VDWINLAEDSDNLLAVVNMVMNPGIPWKAKNLFTRWVVISFSGIPLHGISYLCKNHTL